jgi:hypothetical protein
MEIIMQSTNVHTDSPNYRDGRTHGFLLALNPHWRDGEECARYIRIVRMSLPHHLADYMAGWREGIMAGKHMRTRPAACGSMHDWQHEAIRLGFYRSYGIG